jgi:hypothetical protein
MIRKIVDSLDAQELFKVLPKKMSPLDVQRLQAAIGPGNTKIDNMFVLHKVTGMDFDSSPYSPEVPEPDTNCLPMKVDPMELVPPARVYYLDKKEWIYKANKADKFEYLGLTDKPDSATGMLISDGNVKISHVDAEGTFVPIDVNYPGLQAAFDAAFSKKQIMPAKCNIAAALATVVTPTTANATDDPPSNKDILNCIRCHAIFDNNAYQLAKSWSAKMRPIWAWKCDISGT